MITNHFSSTYHPVIHKMGAQHEDLSHLTTNLWVPDPHTKDDYSREFVTRTSLSCFSQRYADNSRHAKRWKEKNVWVSPNQPTRDTERKQEKNRPHKSQDTIASIVYTKRNSHPLIVTHRGSNTPSILLAGYTNGGLSKAEHGEPCARCYIEVYAVKSIAGSSYILPSSFTALYIPLQVYVFLLARAST